MGISPCGGCCATWLILLLIFIFSHVTSGLQTCFPGTEKSSNQILLDVSTTQINTLGGMCSCRLTVSQTTQVDMFTTKWAPACDSYMIIQKWRISTQCTTAAVSTPPPQTNTVTTGEEIWMLVVATKPGVKALTGQLQLKVKQPSDQLHIECFESNTNSSTKTTPTTTTPFPTTVTSIKTTSKRTEKLSSTSTKDSTPQAQTASGAATGDTSTSSSTGITPGSAATPAGCTQVYSTPTQDAITDNTRGSFPGGIFAAGVATGVLLVLSAGGLYVVISRRNWWKNRSHNPDDIPVSDVHPTYSGLTARTEEPINTPTNMFIETSFSQTPRRVCDSDQHMGRDLFL